MRPSSMAVGRRRWPEEREQVSRSAPDGELRSGLSMAGHDLVDGSRQTHDTRVDGPQSGPQQAVKLERRAWPRPASARTGSNCCRSQTRSRARNRSTARSSSRRWRTPSRRRPSRAMAPRTTFAPRSIPRRAKCGWPAFCRSSRRSRTTPSRSSSRRRQEAQCRSQDRRLHLGGLAAARFRPGRRAERQAGHRAEGARGRA